MLQMGIDVAKRSHEVVVLDELGRRGEILQPAAGKRGYVEAALPNYFRRRPTVDFGLAVTSLIQACWLIRSRG